MLNLKYQKTGIGEHYEITIEATHAERKESLGVISTYCNFLSDETVENGWLLVWGKPKTEFRFASLTEATSYVELELLDCIIKRVQS